MNKKGQINQIFVWIFVLIVAVSILFFGIKLIRQGEGLKDDVLIIKFFNDLDKKMSQYYYLDKGSKGGEEFFLPTDVKYICFVGDNGFSPSNFDSVVSSADKGLIGELRDYSNVFVGPLNLYKENRIKLETKFMVEDNPFCLRVVNGKLSLTLENEGAKDGVKVF